MTFAKPFAIAMFLEDGSTKLLGLYDTYDQADQAIDRFWDYYPTAVIDLIETPED